MGGLVGWGSPADAAGPSVQTAGGADRGGALPTLVLALASALHGLAASSVVCSVPAIAATLHVTHGAELVVAVFFLGAGLGVLLGGRVADVVGPRWLLLAGLGAVVMASCLAAVAPSFATLLLARGVLGAATASLCPAAIALLGSRNIAAGKPTTWGLAVIVTMSEVAFGMGPALGAAISISVGWRAGSALLAPLAAVLFVLAWRILPKPADGAASVEVVRRLDLAGVVLGVSGAAVGLTLLAVPPYLFSGSVILPTVLGALVAAVIVHALRRGDDGFLDVRLLCSSPIALGLGRVAATSFGVYAVMFGLPLWAASALRWSPLEIGVALVPVAVVAAISVVLCRGMLRRRGPDAPIRIGVVGLAGTGAAVVALLVWPHGAMVELAAVMVGVTCGANYLATQHGSVAASPPSRLGGVASWSRFVQFASGQAASLALLVVRPGTTIGLLAIAAGVALSSVALVFTCCFPRR